jgi:cytochrome c553
MEKRFLVRAIGITLACWMSLATSNAWAQLAASVLPTSRSVQVGNAATAFATIINAGTEQALGCAIQPITSVDAAFQYQTTNPATNQPIGTADTPADIAAGGFQTYFFAFMPNAAFDPVDVRLSFDCTNTDQAPVTVGLNTLLLSASSDPVPDIVALAATADSIPLTADLPGNTGASAFSVATVNVGAPGTITTTADTGGVALPVLLSLCETNPATGACINPTAPTTGPVTTNIGANATPTFAIFVTGSGDVPFDPANNRVFVAFKDDQAVTRGSTSVAVQTIPDTPVPDVTGPYTGLATLTTANCLDPADNRTQQFDVTFSLPNQTDGAFDGNGTLFTTIQGVTVRTVVAISGTVSAAASVSGNFDSTTFADDAQESTAAGTFTGTLSGDMLSLDLSGQDTSGDVCTITENITATRGFVDATIAAGATVWKTPGTALGGSTANTCADCHPNSAEVVGDLQNPNQLLPAAAGVDLGSLNPQMSGIVLTEQQIRDLNAYVIADGAFPNWVAGQAEWGEFRASVGTSCSGCHGGAETTHRTNFAPHTSLGAYKGVSQMVPLNLTLQELADLTAYLSRF